MNFFFVFIYCTEQLNLKNISYWHYFTTKIMSICPIWNFTLYVTQSLHFFENHPNASRMQIWIFTHRISNINCTYWISTSIYDIIWISSCAFEFEKSNKQSLKIDPGKQKKTGNVKCNKTIIGLHFVQYDMLWSIERQYWPRLSALVNIAFQCSITQWSAIIVYYYMTSDNVFSDWLTSLVTFFYKTLYSTRKKSREVNIIFQSSSRHLKIKVVANQYRVSYLPLMCYCCVYKAPCKNVDLVYLSDLVWYLWWIGTLYIDNICCFHHHITITDKK